MDFTIVADYEAGCIKTQFSDGTMAIGSVVGNDIDRLRMTAMELGYGDTDVALRHMVVDNDLLHSFVCVRAGLPFCPVLYGTAHKRWWFLWQEEDNAVLAVQAMLNGIAFDELPDWRQAALHQYLRWTRPAITNPDSIVREARTWLWSKTSDSPAHHRADR